jgi:rare lipoprotein A
MGLSLRVPFVKALTIAVALVASVALAQGKANAEPVLSSWYGPGLEGNYTASGEIFDPYGYTAASPVPAVWHRVTGVLSGVRDRPG